MANERKNEQLIRKQLRKWGFFNEVPGDIENIDVFEQNVDNTSIFSNSFDKASKKGTGSKGYPEFLIHIKNRDIAIIIESKANASDMHSLNLDKPVKYALDGAVWYSRFIDQVSNVLAIGSVGEDEVDFRMDMQYFTNGKLVKVDTDLKEIGTPENIFEKFNFDKNSKKLEILSKVSSKLHKLLFEAKSQTSENPLLISATLIALTDDEFRRTYAQLSAASIAKGIIDSVKKKLREADLPNRTVTAFTTRISFIKTHPLTKHRKITFKMIVDLLKVNVFENMEQGSNIFADEIGHFYNEFLKYTGSGDGKGLGIVLTPFYIAELFADLAKVDKNSRVIDIAAGTGGFLVAALKKMYQDNPNDEEKEIVRTKGLGGFEIQSNIFSLLFSNMIIRNDGKSNIYNDSSLNYSSSQINEMLNNPTVGMINPPYSQKETELKFMQHMLDSLESGGIGIAIVPSSICKLDSHLKERIKLLKSHTLIGAFTMKHDLFGLMAGVNTNILVFEAHKPHEKSGIETYFGNWQNDGMIRKKGSVSWIDSDGVWEDIKNKWVSDFWNKKTDSVNTITKNISPEDNWIPEDYLENDIKQTLKIEDIDKHILALHNQMIKNGEFNNLKNYVKEEQIDFKKWNKVKFTDMFELVRGKAIPQEFRKSGMTPYVGASMNNNGISEYITPVAGQRLIDYLSISFGAQGQTGSGTVFYQKYPYVASATVFALKPKFEINDETGVLLSAILETEKFRFNFGNKPDSNYFENLEFIFPIKNGEIDIKEVRKTLNTSKYRNLI